MPDDRLQNIGSACNKARDYFHSFAYFSDLCLHDHRLTGFMERFTLGLSTPPLTVLDALTESKLHSGEVESCLT
jgi:hypothetical protein